MQKGITFLLFLLYISIPVSWADNWYVDNTINGSGTSWANAWNDFDNINWDSIDPGDTLYISGGSSSKTYSDRLFINNVHGTSSQPITIRVGQDAGHDGQVIITNHGEWAGIVVQDSTYITINGNVGGAQNMIVRNCSVTGFMIANGTSHHIKVSYLDIYDNGDDADEDGFSVKYNGETLPIVELSYSKIHENWQDQIKAFGGGNLARNFGYIIIHHNEIYDLHDDGFESGAGGIDFYNNEMHSRASGGGDGHTDGLQFYGEYYRIYNNVFRNFDADNLSSTSCIYIHTGTSSGINRPVKEVYIYNNLFYEDQIYSGYNVLRGILFAPQDNTTTYISSILIANNTIIGMPAAGISAKFNDFNLYNVDNVIIANNLIHNCYTNGGGQAINFINNISNIFNTDSKNKMIAEKKNQNFFEIAAMILGGLFFSCRIGDPGTGVFIDNNLISAGTNGSDEIGFCDEVYTYEDWVDEFNLNRNGVHADPSLNSSYMPDNINDPVVDAGCNLSNFFTDDLNGNNRSTSGTNWDIGVYEYVE